MIERRIQHNMHDSVTSGGVGLVSAGNPPQMLSRQPSQAQASYAAYGGEPAYPSFHPGQIMSPPPTANTPDSWGQHTANAGPQDGWGEGSPFGSPYDSVQGPLLRQQSQQYGAPQPPLSRSGSVPPRYSQEPASAHYADLSRSSVTPFQAAQYEEISRKLQSPPAQALPALPEAREAISPFADPAEHEHEQSAAALRAVNDSPTLPERAHVPRVASVPPMLPEIASLGSGHGDAAPQAAAVPAPAPVARRSADATPAPEQKRPETVYDDSDVYGGI
ncbi:hypothetical protein PLICRDRAFT_306815 [Plicaturopsis crispa FD-325 SS-3]|nr:hypothetical protein PLICRDRAFT_306815 [Plicaturopsis crispa FD-325 SS-3]